MTDRLLTKKELRHKIGFSFAHIDRLEAQTTPPGRISFPRRVRIGFRVFWSEIETDRWIADQLAHRS